MGEKICFSIFHKILIAMFFIALIPLSGLWFFTYYYMHRTIQTQIEKELKEEVNHIVRKVNDWTDMNIRILHQNSLLGEIKSMETDRQKPVVDTIKKVYEWTGPT
jgi:acetylornithine deacetylase/succinyl-diaminopimelate desuccinylase-like protein